jgi:hypothetical protein
MNKDYPRFVTNIFHNRIEEQYFNKSKGRWYTTKVVSEDYVKEMEELSGKPVQKSFKLW